MHQYQLYLKNNFEDAVLKNLIGFEDLHDWEIVGINISRHPKEVLIELELPEENKKILLTLKKVNSFFCSEFKLQNVILDCMIFEKHSISEYFRNGLDILGVNSEVFNESSKIKLVYFEPSNGALLICLFEDFIFS